MWEPRIVAAHAFSPTHFVVAYGELEYDDPFTAILEYDEAFPQPWSRTDVAREIKAIAPAPAGESCRFTAASDEGEVYFIGDADPIHEKIPGAGIASPDANGAGGILALGVVGDTLFAAGQGQQLFRRDGKGVWTRIDVVRDADPGFLAASFTRIASASASDVYLLGFAAPEPVGLDKATQEKLEQEGDWTALAKAFQDSINRDGGPPVDEGRVYHWDGKQWSRLQLPTKAVLKEGVVTTPDDVWLVGTNGAIFNGNARNGFRNISPTRDETFLSMTPYRDAYVLAADYGLFTFDKKVLAALKPRLRRAPPNPFAVKAFGPILVYFDYKQGVHRFDGTDWQRIDIPPQLLERNFKGLPPRAVP